MEYYNGQAWVPAGDVQTAEVDGQTIEYSYALTTATSNTQIDNTITLPVSVPAGFVMQLRFRCVANWQASGSGALAAPNGGTMRFAGAGDADSPRIKIVE